jgi:demethylmenaquinone methyltransferase/2-methoxy-6-polyprenyl-1,4-benzoquinol methylase
MESEQLQKILKEVYRVLKREGIFTLVDFHHPTNFLFKPPLWIFLWLFETKTAWRLLKTDLPQLLTQIGFQVQKQGLHAGGSIQVIQAKK